MKKSAFYIMVLCTLCIGLFGCSSNKDSFAFTTSEFIENYSKYLVKVGATITPTIATFDMDDGVNEISPYIIKPELNLSPDTILRITANKKTKKVVNISISSQFAQLLKADGTSENITNLDFGMFVNQVAITLDESINIDEFGEKYKLIGVEDSIQKGKEKEFYCYSNVIGKYRSFTFVPDNPFDK